MGSSDSPLVRRLFWNLLPLMIVVGAVGSTLLGEEGLLKRHALKQRLYSLQDQVEHLEDDNARLAARVRRMRHDPERVKRAAAQDLLLAEPGATLYRFDPPTKR